jgi:tetratricopeptide (TPR) repeat protein
MFRPENPHDRSDGARRRFDRPPLDSAPMLFPCRNAARGGRFFLRVAPPVLCAALGCRAAPPATEPRDPAPTGAPIPRNDTLNEPGPGPLETPQELDRTQRVIAFVEAGELRAARALLDELLIEEDLAVARELVDTAPEDALTAIDEALEISPRHPDAAYLKGRASLALAEKAIAAGGAGGPGLIEGALQDALEYFRRAGGPPEAAFGAARAATLLGDWTAALEEARRGRELLAAGEVDEDAVRPPPLRTLAEAFFGSYVEARSTGTSAEDARALFLESETALENLLGRTPEDPWVWGRLSDLHEWAGDFAAAEKRVEEGLARAPEDGALLERLARVARGAGGAEHSAAVLEAHVAAAPRNGLAAWLLARERFDQVVEGFVAGSAGAADFERAEVGFVRASDLDPARKAEADPYVVICRAGRGWSAFRADELEEAERAFLSMNEVFPEGVKWSLPGRIDTGIQGLAAIADRHYQLEELEKAGAVFEQVHRLEPESPLWANNAGFILRDAATALDDEARQLCALARGAIFAPEAASELRAAAGLPGATGATGATEASPDAAGERSALLRAANERIERAIPLMERSYVAYRDAAALAPSDVRIVNDTALILVYYLHRELDHAEQLLRSCVEMGKTQVDELQAKLAAEDLDAAQRDALDQSLYELENAWGDVFQNLGILELVHRGNPAGARAFFERSLEIGPGPRPDITSFIYPVLEGTQDMSTSDFFSFVSFGRACE